MVVVGGWGVKVPVTGTGVSEYIERGNDEQQGAKNTKPMCNVCKAINGRRGTIRVEGRVYQERYGGDGVHPLISQ